MNIFFFFLFLIRFKPVSGHHASSLIKPLSYLKKFHYIFYIVYYFNNLIIIIINSLTIIIIIIIIINIILSFLYSFYK